MSEEEVQGAEAKYPSNIEICAARYVKLALLHLKLVGESLPDEQRKEIMGEMKGMLELSAEEFDSLGIELESLVQSSPSEF